MGEPSTMQAPVPAATQQISAMEGVLCGRKKTLRAHKDMVESWTVAAVRSSTEAPGVDRAAAARAMRCPGASAPDTSSLAPTPQFLSTPGPYPRLRLSAS